MIEQFLIDTSAYMRLARERSLRDAWRPYFQAGLLSICPVTELEIYYTARSHAHHAKLEETIKDRYCWAFMPDEVFDRALEVQELMTERGTHKSAGPVDLLLAATAEAHKLTVLHYDKDFLTVAEVTGQPTRWIAKPGSVS